MAKGDIYYLIDPQGYINAKFEQKDDYMYGDCYTCNSWIGDDNEPCEYDFFADIHCKWDACTHWRFKGEDYDPETDEEHDSYYHICGEISFLEHIRTMCFLWKIASEIFGEDPAFKNSMEWYFEKEETKQLIEMMLKNYTIKKEEK